MKIQLKSDLHWENSYAKTFLYDPQLKTDAYVNPEADVLILAGDMINATEVQINYLLHKFKDVTIPILYVPGNHEYWGQKMLDARDLLRKKLSGTNITLLDRYSTIIKSSAGEEALFVGATLWTNLVNPQKAFIAKRTRDFEAIQGITTDSWSFNHISDLSYIERTLDFDQYRDLKKVVISHYLPSKLSVPMRFRDHEMNCIFVAEGMESVIKEHKPNLYVHGHTHDKNDYMIGKTRVVSNPKGRMLHTGVYENHLYDNALIIEI